ncbi:hypothetical protein GCM10010359_55480 [Streptomyces morookaense]|nr:hypothetical protein GCM10010359_55480 [Streptomyces morookaense]
MLVPMRTTWTNTWHQPRDDKAWCVRGVTALLVLPLLALDLMFIGLSPMATDSCGPDHCSAALMTSLAVAPVVWFVAAALLVLTWALPSRPRYGVTRGVAAAGAFAAGALVIGILANLPMG